MPLQLTTTIAEVRQIVAVARARQQTIGLVPTMGALHAGHACLIRAARQETGLVVVSLFVNPTQFAPGEDFDRYPRTPDEDLELCTREGVDVVFAPSAEEMYPTGYCTYVEVHGLQHRLCGVRRPTHFRGVATVVLKLFNIVSPDVAYFGQKDAQQARIIAQMVRDLNLPVRLRVCPTVREPDGLALSSRNRYLSPAERQQAVVLYQALEEARQRIAAGERDATRLQQVLQARIATAPLARLEYADVVDADTLQPLTRLRGRVLLALAVHFGNTRLIDNLLLEIPSEETTPDKGSGKDSNRAECRSSSAV